MFVLPRLLFSHEITTKANNNCSQFLVEKIKYRPTLFVLFKNR